MKKVMIALDYDPTAKKVAREGYKLAQAMDAEVTLLHVLVNPTMYAAASSDMSVWQLDTVDAFEALEIFETESQKFLEKVKKHLGDANIKTIHKEGDFAQMILETATEIYADCIVLGTHSHKWLENILMGSVTEEVLRKTTIPMFIVPTKKQD